MISSLETMHINQVMGETRAAGGAWPPGTPCPRPSAAGSSSPATSAEGRRRMRQAEAPLLLVPAARDGGSPSRSTGSRPPPRAPPAASTPAGTAARTVEGHGHAGGPVGVVAVARCRRLLWGDDVEGQPPRTRPHGGVVGWCGDPERGGGGGGHGGQYGVRGRRCCVDWIWGFEAGGRGRRVGRDGEERDEVGGG